MATKTITVNCPKCDGKKYIDGVSHIANGVCFCCSGAGTIQVTAAAIAKKVSPETIRRVEFLETASPETVAKMTWRQLSDARDFAHCNHAYGYGERAYQAWFKNFNAVWAAKQNEVWEANRISW